MDELNDQKLQKLLKLKKLETPGKEYFDGFLEEFHRYQRAEMFRKASRWEPLHAWLREIFVWEPRRTLAVGGSFAAVAVLLTVGVINFGGNSMKQGQNSSVAKSNVIPNANVQLVSDTGAAEHTPKPRYATGQATLSYDKAIAF